ncbi:hypothetical protein ACXO82_01700 [Lactobacillus delbrueckii subsp. bulgaricus]|uniref:hypothetical protein n=1 Tax=Lactobacillus phage phiJB TaxID=1399941 RepID=UPI0003B03354|nr:hypothetical protein [Lactobacillus delbrueckii]YP_008772015.1 hypothetical protein phiJB_00002 [Lactobacillus phage phiJB]AGW43633.1 hypothetical protein phiJB_00002 [Lactobacillus phage phiJB]MCD5475241.1 hypothetical protein [Lactobacillus delbrueckii subsp. bulgaricus]
MEIIVNSINQTYTQDESTSQIIVALSGNSTSGNGDYLSASVNITAKNPDDLLDSEIETLARKKLADYAAGAMAIRVSSINRVFNQSGEVVSAVVSLNGTASDGSGDYINYRKTITSADLPEGKTFAEMSAGALKALAKAQLVNDTKVA